MREEGEEEEEEDEQGGERDAVETGRTREGREGGTVSGSACKKEQVSIYTASPRIKDPAEYVGKSRRVLVLLFLFATSYFLSLSFSFSNSFSRDTSLRCTEDPPPKIGK